MKIVNSYPPNIEVIKKVFTPHKGNLYAYGDTIYNPNNTSLNIALIAHEEVHSKQQGNDVEGWWARYLEDKEFRLSQEVEAYRAQYKVTKCVFRDRNKLDRFVRCMAEDLSSAIYGNMVSYSEARKLIVA